MTTSDEPVRGDWGGREGIGTQVIVLGWCIWLAGAWATALAIGSPVVAARWLMIVALMGLMLVWPAVRLSEGPRARLSPAAVWGEWLCLVLVLQAAIWPLRIYPAMHAPDHIWRLDQTLWLAGAMAAWSLLSAALLAMGLQGRGALPRTLAMAMCTALVLGEPVAMAVAATFTNTAELWSMRFSPLATVWALVHPALDVTLGPWPARVLGAAAAAVAAWVVVALSTPLAER